MIVIPLSSFAVLLDKAFEAQRKAHSDKYRSNRDRKAGSPFRNEEPEGHETFPFKYLQSSSYAVPWRMKQYSGQ